MNASQEQLKLLRLGSKFRGNSESCRSFSRRRLSDGVIYYVPILFASDWCSAKAIVDAIFVRSIDYERLNRYINLVTQQKSRSSFEMLEYNPSISVYHRAA